MVRRYFAVLFFAFIQILLGSTAFAEDVLSQRLSVQSVSLTSSDKLPDSVASEENRDRLLAFDRDTTTTLTLYDNAILDVALEGTQTIQSLKIFGAAPYRLEIFSSPDAKKPTHKENLTNLGDGWNTITLSNALISDNLRLVLIPQNGSSASGLGEIEFWGVGSTATNLPARAMELMDLNGGVGQWRTHDFAIDGDVAVISPADSDNSEAVSALKITTEIPYLPTEIRRVWLNYELKGEAAMVSLQRSFNGFAGQGGYPFQPDADWTEQLELIDPTQLVQGENTLVLAIGQNTSAFEIQNVRLVVELAQGAKLIDHESVDVLLDGDPGTVISYGSGDASIALGLEKRSQVNSVSLTFASTGSGSLEIDALQGGQWGVVSGQPVELSGLVSGDQLSVPVSAPDATDLRIRVSSADISYSLSEVGVVGSELGQTWGTTELNVTWPEAGQNYGEVAVVRGYISQHETEDGAAQLFVADLPVPMSKGAFEVVVSREQAGYGNTDVSTPWAVNLRLVRPNGTQSQTNIHMAGMFAETGNDDFLPEPTVDTVTADAASVLTNDGAVLEIDPLSVDQDTDISITPLLEAEIARLDLGLANVTRGQGRAYRMLPHMEFRKKIKIKLDYDETLIPAGYSDEDVKIYFFDTASGRWVALNGTEVNGNGKWIRAETDHFTDFIAGVVVAPESPQTASFNPTQIQGIKAADPTAKINLIQAPSANSNGDATLGYPIELPAGRLGLAPSLQVGYSSAGGNGWMGMGWNLNVPEISVDTRWGVPRYDGALETETYAFNGQMLTPVAHRTDLIPREANREFHTRTEGGFQKIIRHGNSPANYWFEVTDKMGTTYAYGGTPSTMLTDDAGNVFRWKLREVRDTNDNFISYSYTTEYSFGLSAGSDEGRNIYPASIRYTGHGSNEGAYEVVFTRDRDLPAFTERMDVQIDGRGGFKQVTADLLRGIDVRFDNGTIRSYSFTYETGAFYKTLLKSVTQYGADGTAFNTHTFDYFDDARDGQTYKGFEPSVSWAVTKDFGDIFGLTRAAVLSAGEASTRGGNLFIGIGLFSKAVLSIGAKFGSTTSNTDGTVALVDINGDGLADKVFKSGSSVLYRANQSGPDGVEAFSSEAVLVANLPHLSHERTQTSMRGIEGYFATIGAGINKSTALSEADIYFTDANGDGLVDLANRGTILFNVIGADGHPSFVADSNQTAYPVGPAAVDAAAVALDMSGIYEELLKGAPRTDAVRSWTAPYDGVVSVMSTVSLIEDTSPERAAYETADGVRVAIEHEGTELFSQDIAATDYAPVAASIPSLTVVKGDVVYFRVQSVSDGAYDRVNWAPLISYGFAGAPVDANGLDQNAYSAASDFVLSGSGAKSFSASFDGTVALSGTFAKTGPTSDDVILTVYVNDVVSETHVLAGSQTGAITLGSSIAVSKAVIDSNTNQVVTPADTIRIEISNDTAIDASQFGWLPSDPPMVVYTASAEIDPILDDNGDPAVQTALAAGVTHYGLTDQATPFAPWQPALTETLRVVPVLIADTAYDGDAIFTIKSGGALLHKQSIAITAGVTTPAVFEQAFDLSQTYFFEMTSADAGIQDAVTAAEVQLERWNTTTLVWDPVETVTAQVASPYAASALPQPFQGWAVWGYNGEGARATAPIDIPADAMNPPAIDESDVQNLEAQVDAAQNDENASDALADSGEQILMLFSPDYAAQSWQGNDPETFATASDLSSSRENNNFVVEPNPEAYAGAAAVSKMSRTSQTGYMLFVGSWSKSTSQALLDFRDLNGDQFPDVVSENRNVQFSPMTGGLENQITSMTNMAAYSQQSRANATSVSYPGGSFANAVAAANAGFGPNGFNSAAFAEAATAPRSQTPFGFGGGISDNDSSTDYDLIDLNADGLPDMVRYDGSNLMVRFNYGYKFAAVEEVFGSHPINEGDTDAINAGISAGFNDGVSGFSGGLSGSLSTSRALRSLNDVNGDGLIDAVALSSGNAVTVWLNTGSGFADPIEWNTGGLGSHITRTKSLSLGLGGTIEIDIPIFFFIVLIINPGIELSEGYNYTDASIQDINGDGYADFLRSSDDGQLSAAHGTVDRTNMLSGVNRPLGSTIAVNYERSGNTYDQPSNKWVMNRVEVYDGFDGDGTDTLVSTFAYADGNYDRQEREFYGYSTVTENHLNYASAGSESVYRTITTTYDNDSYYSKGLMLSSVTTDAQGNVFLQTDNTYEFRDIDTNAAADLASLTATVFPQLVRTDKAFFEGQGTAGKETYTTFAYDDLGNVTRFFDAANLDTSTDDVESLIAYHSDVPNYIVGKADSVVVNGNGAEMRRRTATFETGTGNLLEVASINTGGVPSVTNLAYDPRGNLTQVQGAENLNGQRYTLDYTFDPIVQTYVTATADSFGYGSAAEYDFRFGEVIGTTDINAQSITNTLDEFGRVVTITGPYQSSDATITFAYNPRLEVPGSPEAYPAVNLSWALTQHIDTYRDLSDPIETVLFADGLGRVLQTKKDATLYDGTAYTDQMVASGRVNFDFVGRQVEQFYPVSEGLGAQGIFNPTYDSVTPTTTTYDILDRPLTITIPDGASTQMAYGFGPDRSGQTQFQTMFTDAEGKMRETFADVRGLMTSVKEINPTGGQPTIWTSYEYDPLKQITLVTDDQGNQTTSAYDNLGRQIAIDSPDMGLTEFTYDPASNLIAKQTANLAAAGQQINYAYDFGRLMGVNYPQFSGNDISYTYGAPGAADNRANRIVTVASQAGLEERFYGPLGETTKTIMTVSSDTGANPEVYATEYTFDTWNRLQTMTYPDGEILVNAYDSGGKLDQIDGTKAGYNYPYLKEMGYDKFGQRVFVRMGNDTTTSYEYTAETRRLNALQTQSDQTGRQFQDMTYGYDLVGNIMSQANLAENTVNNLLGGATAYSYEYDDLYRLTAATGSWNAPNNPESFTLAMSYDTIHNIASKTQEHLVVDRVQGKTSYDWTYGYNGAQPHAPTDIGDRTYSYDANGNQTGWDSNVNGTNRTIVWDEENRIQSVADNGATTTYKYNDAGERIFKVGAQGETVYVNQFYVIRNGQVASKHIFGGSQRLVSKLASQPVDAPTTTSTAKVAGTTAKVGGGQSGANAGGNNPNAGGANSNGQGSGAGGVNGGGGGNTGGGTGGGGTTNPPQEERTFYFYHPDHLGSSSYVTDIDGEVFQHVEYFPFGETWVEEHSNRQRTPYLFTGKELDEDTQLYYFGARYYDPRTSVWQSPDPILAGMLFGRHNNGVYNPKNLGMYSYSYNSPVTLVDPDGNNPVCLAGPWAFAGCVIVYGGAFITGYELGQTTGEVITGEKTVGEAAQSMAIDAAIGVAGGGFVKVGGVLVRKFGDDVVGSVASLTAGAARTLGKGNWVDRTGRLQGMSPRAREYQEFVSGRTDMREFQLNGVDFDAVDDARGVLIDSKADYDQFANADGTFKSFFSGTDSMVDQATRQLDAAEGLPIEWHVKTPNAAAAIQNLFEERGIDVTVVFRPME